MVDTIDITTTATIRPQILDRTYRSFFEKFFTKDIRYRLVINVDPIGERGKSQESVIEVARVYFDEVIFNLPKICSFSNAVKWCWQNTVSKYVFHLEDDWEMNFGIDIHDVLDILDRYENIGYLRLKKHGFKVSHCGRKMVFPCDFVEAKDSGKIKSLWRVCLNPSFYRGEFVREVADVMISELNPESQLSPGYASMMGFPETGGQIDNVTSKWDKVIWEDPSNPILTDIGRQWRGENKFHRRSDFLYWS